MEILVLVGLGLLAVAGVAYPLIRPRRRRPTLPDERLEARVRLYREALRAGTICGRCLRANPPGSRFCADCGRPVGRAPGGARETRASGAPREREAGRG